MTTLDETIYIVSGLPRSGTSLMMQILEAIGIDPLCDGLRSPDKNNPNGYYEYEPVKQLAKDASFLEEAKGKALKVISMLLYDLPNQYPYHVIFMDRDLEEIILSQNKMLQDRGTQDNNQSVADDLRLHLKEIKEWLENQSNISTTFCHFNRLLAYPNKELEFLSSFSPNIKVDNISKQIINPLLSQSRIET